MSYQWRYKVSTIQVVLKNVSVEDSLEKTTVFIATVKGSMFLIWCYQDTNSTPPEYRAAVLPIIHDGIPWALDSVLEHSSLGLQASPV